MQLVHSKKWEGPESRSVSQKQSTKATEWPRLRKSGGVGHGSPSGCRKQFPSGTRDPGWRGEKSEPAGPGPWGGCTHSQAGGHKSRGPWPRGRGSRRRAAWAPCIPTPCRSSGYAGQVGVLGADLASCPTAQLSQAPSFTHPSLLCCPAGRPNRCTLPPESRAADRMESWRDSTPVIRP